MKKLSQYFYPRVVAIGLLVLLATPSPVEGQGRDTNLAKALCGGPVVHAQVDPIVRPGGGLSQHLHQFYGNAEAANPTVTYQSMLSANTTCSVVADKAGYWAPVLMEANGRQVPVKSFIAYYYRGAGAGGAPRFAGSGAVAYPPDLRLVAGNPTSTVAQSTEVVYWNCGAFSSRSDRYPSPVAARCSSASDSSGGRHKDLRLHVTFPDCWNRSLASRSGPFTTQDNPLNVVYSDRRTAACPSSHPVKLPTLNVDLRYSYDGSGTGLRWSSGPISTTHVDFWNTWDQRGLERFVSQCINPSRQGRVLPAACDGP